MGEILPGARIFMLASVLTDRSSTITSTGLDGGGNGTFEEVIEGS